ncbi:MAG: carboxypeptidase-like regulatory domain-containing protein, partial [Candidatus Acidiferrales bacterium]
MLLLFNLPAAHSIAAQQSAAPPGPLTGIVKTPEGTPVPGATVRLVNDETHKVWLSWTDESGKFEFPQIAPGQYRIEANQLGFTQTSLTIQVPVVPPGAIPILLRVATLAELSAAPGKPAANPNRPTPRGNGAGNNNGQNNNALSNGQYRGGGAGGRGQVPAGVANALREGLAGGGFEQTDLTGEGSNSQTAEANGGAANEGPQAEAALQGGANSNATSDSFLLQGTVGQSSGGSGPGGFGQEGLIPGTPGDQGGRGGRGGAGGQMFGPGPGGG